MSFHPSRTFPDGDAPCEDAAHHGRGTVYMKVYKRGLLIYGSVGKVLFWNELVQVQVHKSQNELVPSSVQNVTKRTKSSFSQNYLVQFIFSSFFAVFFSLLGNRYLFSVRFGWDLICGKKMLNFSLYFVKSSSLRKSFKR